jgi:hypothetical protein
MKQRTLMRSNAKALIWCQNRQAIIQYKDWSEEYRKVVGIRKGRLCGVMLDGNKCFVANTLMQCVNRWIKWLDDADHFHLKPTVEDSWIHM